MGTIIMLIILVVAVMLMFFKNDILNKNASSNKLSQTSGFVVCVATLLVMYFMNR